MANLADGGRAFNYRRKEIKALVKEQFNVHEFVIPNLGAVGNAIPIIAEELEIYYTASHDITGKKGDVPWEMKVHQAMSDGGTFFGYNKSTGAFNLFTSNAEILADLGALDRYVDSKTYERNVAGVINAMRIDVTYTDLHGNYTAKAVRTAGKTEIALDNYIIIPTTVIQQIMYILKDLLRRRSILRITSEFSNGSKKTRLISMKDRTLSRASGGERDAEFIDFSLTGRLYAPVLNAPLTTTGLTAIRFDSLDRVEVLNARTVTVDEPDNTIEAVIQNEILGIFVSQVFNQGEVSEAKRKLFRILEQYTQQTIPSNASRIDVTSMVRDLPTDQKNHLWSMLPKVLREYSGRIHRIMNSFTPVDVPESEGALRDMLKNGLYRIVMLSKTGKFYMMYATNNMEYLHIAYGDNYVAHYESKGYRIGYAYRLLRDGVDVEKALDRAGVRPLFDPELSDSQIVQSIMHQEEENEFRPGSSSGGSGDVMARTLFYMRNPESVPSIYRSLSLNKIYSLARLDG